MKHTNALLGVALYAASVLATAGSSAGPALERPALSSRHAAASVLLGIAAAGQRIIAVGERGIVVLSDDCGKTWRQVPTPVSVTLSAVRFFDARHGYAVGHAGVVLATADGGETWVQRLDGKRIAQLALQAAQAANDAGKIRDAQRLVADGADKPLLDVAVFDAEHALVVGAYGLAFATEDGGRTWTSWGERFANPKALHLYAVRRQGDSLLVAGEQGMALLSADAGKSFKRLQTPYAGSFFTAEITPAAGIVLAGLRGNVWQSHDGGAQWTRLAAPTPATITASANYDDGTLLLANQAGMVMTLRQDRLAPLPAQPLPPLTGLLPRTGGDLLAVSMQGVMSIAPVRSAPAGGKERK